MTKDELLPTSEAAAHLGVTPRTVARMVERGELHPVVKTPGPRGAFLFKRADIDYVAAERSAEHQAVVDAIRAAGKAATK